MQLIYSSAVVVVVYMTCLFLLARMLKNNSIVDIGWGIGFILVVFNLQIHRSGFYPAKLIMLIFITLWGLRLSIIRIQKKPFLSPPVWSAEVQTGNRVFAETGIPFPG